MVVHLLAFYSFKCGRNIEEDQPDLFRLHFGAMYKIYLQRPGSGLEKVLEYNCNLPICFETEGEVLR